jgi:hypothetical protein
MEGLLYYNMEGSLKWLEYSFYRCIDVAAAKWAIIMVPCDIIFQFEYTQHLYNRSYVLLWRYIT